MNADANSKKLVYVNGHFVPEDEARISVFDRGFLYGDGVFETMRSYEGRMFRLTEHLKRLRQSADIIELRLPHEPEQFADICKQLLVRNGLADAILRLSVTRGRSAGGIGTSQAGEPSVVAFIRPPRPLPDSAYSEGVSARVVSVRRNPSSALDARMKSMNFLNNILAKAEADRYGAYQAIMLDHAGRIAEASTANVFFARDGELLTPGLDCDILPGITRAAVLEVASDMGIPYEERKINPAEISGFSECFLSSSGVELVPVTQIDDQTVGAGTPGPLYARLHAAYRELVRKE